MRHEVQVKLIKQLETHLDAGTNVDAGGLMLNPTSVYVDPELAAREWNEFFVGYPQVIGLSGDLAAPGSFMTIDDLGVPILATRDSEGQFRAFVNACRHRGALVENRERGDDVSSFSCPFHNWTYGLDGTLIGLTKPDHFGDVDTASRGLVELPATERHGILWIHPDPAGTIDVDALLGDELSDEFASWNFDGLRYLGGDTYDVACNWKLAMDTFGETYHFPVLHSNSLNLAFHGNVQLLPSDFGCFLVRAYPTPGKANRHVSRISFYAWPGTVAGSEAETGVRNISENFASIIRDEDYVVAASQQRSADNGSLEHVLFGRNEPALHHYHSTYRAALGMPALPLFDDHDVV